MSEDDDKHNHSWRIQSVVGTNNDTQHPCPDAEEAKPVDQTVDVKAPKAKTTPKPIAGGSGLDSLGGGNIL